jgi:predicted AAA+ superfamily ATPase
VTRAATPDQRRLKSWREVAIPRQEVLEGNFGQAEFAADLTAEELGRATPECQDAASFFDMTFLTEGMRKVLGLAAERLAGIGGEPVIGLQTAFGGGKTHTMLALRHLATAPEPTRLAGLADILHEGGRRAWRPARCFILVGTGLGARQRLSRDAEPSLYTPWGLMAWRLAGQTGLDLMAEAESTRSAPGSERLVTLLEAATPCLVLLDELVAYARVLDADGFEAFLNFVQSLTEAVKMVPGSLMLGSLIESDAEAGGERGVEARRRLERIFGRVQSPWVPAHGHEQYDIVRRRLFQELEERVLSYREGTVRAFAELYHGNRDKFPSETGESAYRDRMARAYPIHPELFRLFAEVWVPGANEKFQQTRGVLRLMATAISVLWQADDPNPLVLPSSLPLADTRMRGEVLTPIDPHFASVLDSNVEGSNARSQIVDAERHTYGSVQATTRAARAVFLATAPLSSSSVAGVTGPQLRLACAQPGDQINMFGDALRELAETAAFLHRDDERAWFSTVPTLNRLAADLAKDLSDRDVDTKLNELLAGETAGSKFRRAHLTTGDDPAQVEDTRALGLVILDTRYPHTARAATDTPAMKAAADVLERRGSSQRQYRNALLFAAPDEERLDDARAAARRLLAWSMIAGKAGAALQLPPRQQSEARSRRHDAFNAARRAIRGTWLHLIEPYWPDDAARGPSRGYALHAAPIRNSGGEKSIAAAAFEKAARDGAVVVEKLGALILARLLDRVIGDQPHVAVRDLVEWSARYVHMKRLHTESLFAGAIEELIGSAGATYAWADKFDAGDRRYIGLRTGRVLFPDVRGPGVLVRRQVAEQQAAAKADSVFPESSAPARPGFGESPAPPLRPPTLRPKQRFFGTVTVDPTRLGPLAAEIAQSILTELARAGDATLTVKVGIVAEHTNGFPPKVIASVADKARDLNFEQSGFE